MKKITLLMVSILFTIGAFAQSNPEPADPTTSFEQSEGYQLGNLDEQNNWEAEDSLLGPAYADLMVVTDEAASDGLWSLKMKKDENGILGGNDLESAARLLDIPSGMDGYSISFDIYLSSDGIGEIAQVIFVDIQEQTDLGGFIIADLTSQNNGQIAGAVIPGTQTMGNFVSISFDQFVHCKVVFGLTAQRAQFYVDGGLVATYDIDGTLGFMGVFSTGLNSVYLDNIVGQEASLEVKGFQKPNFTHYTWDNTLFLTGDSQIGNVAIYNLLGQEVTSKTVKGTSGEMDLTTLNSGVYVAKVSVNGRFRTFKIVKK